MSLRHEAGKAFDAHVTPVADNTPGHGKARRACPDIPRLLASSPARPALLSYTPCWRNQASHLAVPKGSFPELDALRQQQLATEGGKCLSPIASLQQLRRL